MAKCQHCQSEYVSGDLHCPNCFEPVPIIFDRKESSSSEANPNELIFVDDRTSDSKQEDIILPNNNDDPFSMFFSGTTKQKPIDESAGKDKEAAKGKDVSDLDTHLESLNTPDSNKDYKQGALDNNSANTTLRPYLLITKGQHRGIKLQITDDIFTIGRWDPSTNAFVDLDMTKYDTEAKISRKHVRISLENSNYYIEDIGSTNGTHINKGDKLIIGNKILLRHGDEIIIGMTFLKFFVS